MGWVAGEGGKLRLPVKKNPYRRRGETAATARWGPRGEPPFSHRNGVWRVALGAHPKLGALVGALLELRFLPRHIYLAMGGQVGALLELLFACMTSVPKFSNFLIRKWMSFVNHYWL
jgi:hypothetical protein